MNAINSPTATNLARGTIIELAQNVYNNAIAAHEQADHAQEQADRAQEQADRAQAIVNGEIAEIANAVYPVNSIYISVGETSPASLFGGTWEKLKDRFLLGSGDTYLAGSMGGEATHELTIDEIPAHNHAQNMGTDSSTSSGLSKMGYNPDGNTQNFRGNTSATGGGEAHNNMPPYFVVNMWKRVA